MSTPSWDDSYTGERPPPWDIGHPQLAFIRLAEQGMLSGNVLDSGCGTGEHALLAASHGAESVTGIDASPTAIGRARAKAAERGLTARFETGDVLHLDRLGTRFDTITDSGVFHVFSDEDRPHYVTSLATALKPGGSLYLMCFSEREPGDMGPRRVRQDELRSAFSDGWTIDSITADSFETTREFFSGHAQAWLASIRRS